LSRILCLHAHPDDAEFLAAGTLALLAGLGHEITIVTMTAGDCGSDIHGPAEISAIRRREAAEAASRIGASSGCLEFLDLAIFVDDPSRRKVTWALRHYRPDIVLTASPVDYHCDHEATSKLVVDACFGCSAPNYSASEFGDEPALPAIPHLYFMDPTEGRDRDGQPVRPHFTVDISSVINSKMEMLECHESQRAWLRRQHGIDDFVEIGRKWSAVRGEMAGVEYAEGFRHYTGHPWPSDPLLESLLPGNLVHRLS
jgi:LmbE family N-acetylglucosaminyl deacetylase